MEDAGRISLLLAVMNSVFLPYVHGVYSGAYSALTEVPSDIVATETTVFLNGNSISSLDGKLDHLTSLDMLRLDSNAFNTFPEVTNFGGTITMLYLNTNQIDSICRESLEPLTSLHTLSMNYNLLTEFPDMSSVATTLEFLQFSGNQLTTIRSDRLNKLKALKNLYLDNNQLTTSPFVDLPVLNQLILNDNPIQEISAVAMRKLTVPPVLNLRNTAVTTLPPVCFNQTTNLRLEGTGLDLCLCENLWLKQADETGGITTLTVTDLTCPGQMASWKSSSLAELEVGLCADVGETVPDPCAAREVGSDVDGEATDTALYSKRMARYRRPASTCLSFTGVPTPAANSRPACALACIENAACVVASFRPATAAGGSSMCVLQVGDAVADAVTYNSAAAGWQHYSLAGKELVRRGD